VIPAAELEDVPSRAWVALGVSAAGYMLGTWNSTSTNLAFDSIGETFAGVPATTIGWVATVFFIGLGALLPLSGRLADREGRLKVFRAGLIITLISALLSAAAPNVWFLIAARFLQAAGGAAIIPSSLALVLPLFPKHKHATAVTTWAATGPLGAALAPALSAVVLSVAGWRSLFFITAPAAAVVLLAGLPVLAESKAEHTSGPLDIFGTIIGTVAVAATVLAVGQGAHFGWGSPVIVGAAVTALVLVPLFVSRSLHHPEPLVNFELLKIRSVWSANLANAFLTIGGLSSWLIYPLFLQNIWHWEVQQVGLALTLGPIFAGGSSLVSGRLADHFGVARMVRIASLIPPIGMLWAFFMLTEDVNYWLRFAPSMVLFAAGWGFTAPPLNSGALSGVPQDHWAQINASFNTLRNIAGALGIATALAILSVGPETGPEALIYYDRTWLFFAAGTFGCTIVVWLFYPRDR